MSLSLFPSRALLGESNSPLNLWLRYWKKSCGDSAKSTSIVGSGNRFHGTDSKISFEPIQLPELPYNVSALEPVIPKWIMELHHGMHHKAYVTSYNAAMAKLNSPEVIRDPGLVVDLLQAIKFNGGGHINHSLFWKMLRPPVQNNAPSDAFMEQLNRQFSLSSLKDFQKLFNAKSLGIQGSGWGWLCWNKETKSFEIVTTANQDTPPIDRFPLLGIDVWEHAYYLKYENARARYLEAIWDVINWPFIEERYRMVEAP